MIQSFCNFLHFFTPVSRGEAWTGEHPGAFLLSLEDAFERGDRMNALNFPTELGGGR